MATLETFATRFARCVSLFRDTGAKDEQKAEFRALVSLLKDSSVTVRVAGGRIEVNGVPCEGETLTGLVQRLDLHGIGEIALAANPPPAQLFELMRALAEQPGAEGDDVVTRLAAAGASGIRVVPAPGPGVSGPSALPPRAPVATSADFDAREPIVPKPGAPVDRKSHPMGTEGILRGEAWKDIKSVPISGVPLVMHDPPPPAAADALPGTAAPASSPEDGSELSLSGERATPQAPSPPPAPPAPRAPQPPPPAAPRGRASGAARPTAAAPSSASGGRAPLPAGAADVLAELERNPTAPNVGDLLAALVRNAETAVKQSRFEQVMGVIVGIIHVEQRVPETSGMRRQYGIAVRRIYNKPVLQALAQLLATPKHRADAVTALQRGGAAAVEVLMDLLVAAPTVSERRAVFDALKQMTEGTEQLIHMLDHREWFVVRNVAELLGELGMDEGVPALARRLDHADERVRKAVALALAKIGTRSAAEPLRRALRDRSLEVRMQVALGIGGRKSSALAMPLLVAMEEEKDEAVVRELILALGRIGSPDAVQALIKWSQPAGRIFGRKPLALRLAAVDALRLAATPAALGTLEGLADDGDRQIREAAKNAVTELRRPPRP
ncbi:MAG TPA: HEAT repeat domain-containing protein [Gemmatimonadales bacterium]|nr:HEAT repeat domain-containing protein [Gemmatimonadales bacterium]